jgi:hypothetical protein
MKKSLTRRRKAVLERRTASTQPTSVHGDDRTAEERYGHKIWLIEQTIIANAKEWATAWGVQDGLEFRECLSLTLLISLTRHELAPYRWRWRTIRQRWEQLAESYAMQAKLLHWWHHGGFPPTYFDCHNALPRDLIPPDIIMARFLSFDDGPNDSRIDCIIERFDYQSKLALRYARECREDHRGALSKAAFNALAFGDNNLKGQLFGLKNAAHASTPNQLFNVIKAVLAVVDGIALELTGSKLDSPVPSNLRVPERKVSKSLSLRQVIFEIDLGTFPSSQNCCWVYPLQHDKRIKQAKTRPQG